VKESKSRPHIRSHDGIVKFVFGEPEQMAGLLRATLPSELATAIHWATLRRVPGSFVEKDLAESHTDMLFAAQLGDVTVLLHLLTESKSKDDRFTSLQIARYVVRIHDHWRTLHPNATTLPAVLPFVLYHGEKPWAAPRSPKDLVDLTGSPASAAAFLRPLQLHQPFVLLDLSGHTEAEIDAMRLSAIGSLSLRFLQFLRHAPPERAADLILRWQHLVTELLNHPRGRDVLYALFSWYAGNTEANAETLRTVMTKIHQENPPMRSLLDQILEVGEERGLQKGMRRGMRKGAVHGQRRLLEQQIVARFGQLPDRLREQLDTADASMLQAWGLRVLAAPRIEDVFQTP
jgi:predicted transposase YdaD